MNETGGSIERSRRIAAESSDTEWEAGGDTDRARRLSILSHELRNPLATMMAGVDLLQRTIGKEPDLLEVLRAIERSIRLESNLVDELLDLSRIPEGRARMHGAPTARPIELPPPRADAPSPASAPPASAPYESASYEAPSPESAPAGFRLLIVEDNRDTRKVLAYTLRTLGYFVQAAGSAEEALEILGGEIELNDAEGECHAPRIAILADIGLPGLNGYELVRRVRGIRGLERAIAIAVTGWGCEDDVRRAWEAGFDAHFVKPVDIRSLDRKIQELLRTPVSSA